MKTDIEKISALAKLGTDEKSNKLLEAEMKEIIEFTDKIGKGKEENE